jgi:hypothetical protein
MRNIIIPDILKISDVFSALQMLILSAAELQIRQDEDAPPPPLGADCILRRMYKKKLTLCTAFKAVKPRRSPGAWKAGIFL